MDIRFCSITNESIPDGEFESGRAITVGKKSFYVSAALQRLMARSRFRGWMVFLLGLYAVGATSFLLVREANRKEPDQKALATAVRDGFHEDLSDLGERLDGVIKTRNTRLGAAIDSKLTESATQRRELHEAVSALSASFDKQELALAKRLEMSDKRQSRSEEEISQLRSWLLKIQGTAQDLATRFAEERANERARPQPEAPSPAATPAPAPTPDASSKARTEEHERLLKSWIARLKDKDHDVVFTATVKLADLGDLRAAKPLAAVVRDHKDYYARLGAVTALGTLKAVDGVEALIDALDDKDDLVRMSAAENLTAITGEDYPFDADMSRNERGKVKRRWRNWFKENEKPLRERLGQMSESSGTNR